MIKTDIRVRYSYNESDILDSLKSRLGVDRSEIKEYRIIKRTLDINDSGIEYKMTVGASFSQEREAGLLKMRNKVSLFENYEYTAPVSKMVDRPVVCGSGPCGLFAALILAESGARPIILERGLSVDERKKSVERFEKFGVHDRESNIQFGEGGAGAFSDGKLKIGSMDKYKYKVLSEFILAGADGDISYSANAHLGTDRLPSHVKKIREKIRSIGGEFIFSAKMTDLVFKDGSLSEVVYEKDGAKITLGCKDLILATGHSARDVYRLLNGKKVRMESRGFGIGVRIEHPREYVNSLVYGKHNKEELESASYHLVTHLKNGRSVYSFCMCPGGTVVAATSDDGAVVTNGMSVYKRDGDNSNAAFLVSVTPSDFESECPLAGVYLQEKLEKAAFISAGGGYKAPYCSMSEVASGELSSQCDAVKPTYPLGVSHIHIKEYAPEYITESLRASISDFEEWIPGFYLGEAAVTGIETRSTAPVRILRGESYEADGFSGLYPAGEGAGYSGGIISSAVDGIKCAEALLKKYL